MRHSILLKSAVGAALALVAGSAFAVNVVPADNNTVNMSGATATDRTLLEAFLDLTAGKCQNADPSVIADSVDIYITGTTLDPTSPPTYRLDCKLRGGTLNGTVISFAKNAGGSGAGATNVATGATQTFPTRSCTGNGGAPQTFAATANLVGYRLFTGCGTSALAPAVGISDVEPSKLNPAVAGQLTTNGAAVVPMTIGVSKNFYTALQTAQGLTGCSGVANAEPASCVPSLSRQQIRTFIQNEGRQADPSQIFGPTGAPIPQPNPIAGLAQGSALYFCKRSSGSGTEISHQLLWFGEGCRSKGQLLQTMLDSTNATKNNSGVAWVNANGVNDAADEAANFDDINVFSGTGAGDVEACLDWADDVGAYAIGLLSLDRLPNDTTKEFRNVKIDGVIPSVENVQNQTYAYWVENSVNTPNSGSANFGTFNTGIRPTIISEYVLGALRSATVLGRGHVVTSTGRAGLLVRPTSTVTPALPLNAANPVNTTVRATALDTGLENCNEPVVASGLPVIAK